MRKKRKNLMFILLLCLCLEGMSFSVFAVTEYVDGYLRYTVENDSVTITGYHGRASEVVIPAKIAGNPVNRIASGAFVNATMVTKICLPETIMVIEEGAFAVGQEVIYSDRRKNTETTKQEQTSSQKTTQKEEKTSSQKTTQKQEETTSQKTTQKEEKTSSQKTTQKEEKTSSQKTTQKEEKTSSQKTTQKQEETTTKKTGSVQEVNANLSNDSDYIMDVGEEKSTEESDVEVETEKNGSGDVEVETEKNGSGDVEVETEKNGSSDVKVETKSTENEDNRGMFVATALVTVVVLGAVVTAGVVFVRRKK